MATEKRLIDANALIKDWNKLTERMVRDEDGKIPVDFGLVIRELSKTPTVDAVEVVRCKNCRWRKNGSLCYMISGCGVPVGTGDDFFCAYGERRPDDH